MKGTPLKTALICALAIGLCACGFQIGTGLGGDPDSRIVDHTFTPLKDLSAADILRAKETLHIAYGHTSHGSQITSGMNGLVAFANSGGAGMSFAQDIFAYAHGGGDGLLDYREGDLAGDVGYWPDWRNNTLAYLGTPDSNGRGSNHPEINVIMWSWCGQAASRTQTTMLSTYLEPMRELEIAYPGVVFVYMTGHLNASEDYEQNLLERNEQIRDWCRDHDCWLFDFADIETYDPDGNWYGDLHPDDGCCYDASGNGVTATSAEGVPSNDDRNWATDWQNAHTEDVDWYDCGAAHSISLNANRKAYAAWNLWVRIAKEL